MSRSSSDKRERLIEAAANLSYERGFGSVALAEIAGSAAVPLGNVYYYFKTRDSIARAVIEQRCAQFEAMRRQWDQEPSPKERLKALVRMTAGNRENLARSGCPVGSLCAELGKQKGPLADEAGRPLRNLLQWIEQQLKALGSLDDDNKDFALHLLSALQGVSLLANGFRNPALVESEAELLCRWIDGL